MIHHGHSANPAHYLSKMKKIGYVTDYECEYKFDTPFEREIKREVFKIVKRGKVRRSEATAYWLSGIFSSSPSHTPPIHITNNLPLVASLLASSLILTLSRFASPIGRRRISALTVGSLGPPSTSSSTASGSLAGWLTGLLLPLPSSSAYPRPS